MIALWEIPLILLYLFLGLLAIRRISFFKNSGLPKNFTESIFLLKFCAGTFLGLIYIYVYTDRSTADVYKYFDDSKYMSDALLTAPGDFFRMLFGFENDNEYFNVNYYNHMNNWFRKYESNIYNDSHTIIRINAVMRIFSFGSFHVHTLFASFLSLIGLVALYKSVVQFCKGKEKLLALAVFLLPSVVFWSSGVLKESFLLFGLGLFFYAFLQFCERKITIKLLFFAFFSFTLLLYLKVYVLMALLPGMIAYFWLTRSNYKFPFLKYSLILVVAIFAALVFEQLFPAYHMLEIFVQKQQDFIRLAESMQSGSLIEIMPLENNAWSFLKAAPMAFITVLFRPFLWESLSPFMLMAAFENLLLLGGIIAILLRFRKPNAAEQNFILLALSFVILLFVLIGWVTPVLGAMVRYKVPALPFLGVVLVMLYSKTGKKV